MTTNLEDVYPLSPLQQGMLFHSLLAPESGIYVNQCSCRLRGELDAERFHQSWQKAVDRHAILRSAFLWEGFDEPLQAVRSQAAVPWRTEDWRGLSAGEQAARLEELRTAERRRPFQLAQAPLLRLVLIRTGEDVWELVWTFHHILLDGWSVPLLLRELSALYASGDPAALPPVRPYRDYIAWLQRQDRTRAEAFWRQTLAGFSTPTPLGIDRPVPAGAGGTDFAEETSSLPADATAALQAFAARQKVTLNTICLGAWALLLARYSGEEDVVFGAVVSGRPAELPEVESILGLFINTLPVRVRVPETEPAAAWLRSLQARQLELRQFEHSPLSQVQKQSDVPPGTALFESLFVFENYPMAEMAGAGGSPISVEQVRNDESTNYPLTLAVAVAEDTLLRLTYDRSRFAPAAIRRLLGHFARLLQSLTAHADRPLGETSPLDAAELEQLRAWNATEAAFSRDRCLHELVEAQVDRDPEAVALSFEGGTLTYRALDERANRLARHLIELGCAPETPVGVFEERSLELVVSLLAILKTGGAYVPLDPDLPAERIAFQAADAGLPLLLVQENLRDRLPATAARVVEVGAEDPPSAGRGTPRPAVRADPQSPAYVLYTSGSTGRPKGVVVSHRAIVNRLQWMQDAYRLGPDDRVLQKTPFSFDVSVWEFFWPLLAGARLVLARPGGHRDNTYLARLIRSEGITLLHFVPSMLQMFLQEPEAGACRSLRDVMASGEALPAEMAERFFARLGARLHNLYGPTEAAVDVTAWACERGNRAGVPIGRPIWNTRIHLVDSGLRPVPVGVGGELCIAGVNLARGYAGRPDLTAERFLPDPFGGPGERLYRTGDLARHREDGAIEYLGRTDYQVKVRGFRIELGEIEAALLACPGVREAAVAVHEREDGHRRLVAYLAAGDPAPGVEALRSLLGKRLPDYMVPALFVPLPALPLTPSGKVDRRALPPPSAPGSGEPSALPEGLREQALAGIWSSVLGVERVGRDDNFFALGGDSILSLQVLSEAREQGLELSLQQIFQHPTVRQLAALADRGTEPAAAHPRLEPFELLSAEDRARLPEGIEDAYPLARLQAGMLFHSELGPESSIYHNTVSVHLRAPFDLAKLDLALQRLAARHPLLRTSFSLTGFDEPLQLVHREVHIPLETHDLRPLSAAEQEEELDRWFAGETRRLFNWREAPLIRFHVHRRAEDRFQLSWSEHHAILDGWSVAAMATEVGQDYLALVRNGSEAPEPPAPRSRFRDFVALERQVLAEDAARRFWLELLRDAPFTLLPRRAERPPEPARVVSLQVPLAPGMAGRAQAVATRAGVPLKSALLAVHARVLGLVSGHDDLVTGVVNNGRLEEEDGERVFGLFLNTLPYRLRFGGGTWLDLARQCFEMEGAMLPHRRFPLSEIQRLSSGFPLFEVAFTYMNFHVMQGFATTGEMEDLGARNNVPTNFALSVYFLLDELSGQLNLTLDYDASELAAGQMEALAGYYQRALTSLVEQPESRYLSECLLAEPERRQVLEEWNRTRTFYPEAGRCLHELLEAQAARSPEATAVFFEGERLTYRELNERANRLARFLRRLGVGPESRVGVCLERSLDLVVALGAVLKAGGAYVPLDPAYPPDRQAFMAADAQAPVALTLRRWADTLPEGTRRVLMDEESGAWAGESGDDLPPAAGPDNLAYVIYTSGSTGAPKGAMNTHRAVVNRLLWMQDAYRLTAADRVLQKTPFSFDVSVWELFWPLFTGASLVVARPEGHREPDYLAGLIERQGVTTLHFVPSMLRAFLQGLAAGRMPSIRRVFSSGEALPADLERRFFEIFPRAELHNLYGPTEAAVDVTAWACDPSLAGPTVPIGRPIANLRIYLLDTALNPVPPGSPGELHIGGLGLARGYHARPGLTADRFIPDPWTLEPGARLYRTGDLASQRPDGAIEYLGRLDHQVKLRGHRIELGEIESALRLLPRVRDAAVVLREDRPGDPWIVAYVVPDVSPAVEPEDLRALADEPGYTAELSDGLQRTLPEAMVPSAFVLLPELPLSPNGKLDRRALRAPEAVQSKRSYVAPRTPTEEILAAIWAQVLAVPRVGARDSFFELGGHSLLATQIVLRVNEAFGVSLTLRELYKAADLAQLAEAVVQAQAAEADAELLTRLLDQVEQLDAAGIAHSLAADAPLETALE
ncbi:MAG TPA: amino acid adenylation domain-containing protein [Thermoanaerobaculia bacterium]|nr:amino acid adenylation domain-containing protein [Thermoanaerobaculia bacterium]